MRQPKPTPKLWGTTTRLFSGRECEVHRIEVVPGGHSSQHYHNYKFNKFFVESGELIVRVFDQGEEHQATLGPGQEFTVAPGVEHEFEARGPVTALEIYWSHCLPEDIVRVNEGGIRVYGPGR